MKKKLPTAVKDGLTGAAIGTAIIIPGISGGTIALIFGAVEKITDSVRKLFSKDFWHHLLILLPFLIGAIVSVGALYFPFYFAMRYIKFSFVCLFAGLIAGSLPILVSDIDDKKPTISNFVGLFIGVAISVLIGVFSVIFEFSATISSLFSEIPGYLFLIIFGVGIVSAAGLIVPGLSGSLILLVICFYQEIFELIRFKNGLKDFALLVCFAIGVFVGFVFWSILMNKVLSKHHRGTLYVVLGLVLGSLFSIFYNSSMVEWMHGDKFGLLEWILGSCLLVLGLIISLMFSRYVRTHPEIRNA